MSYWDMLPIELQDKIMTEAVRLVYNKLVKHFNTICVSIDARLAAHEYVIRIDRGLRSKTTVFCQTYFREHFEYSYNNHQRRYRHDFAYNEYDISYTKTFGNKKIDSVYEQRGVALHRHDNDVSQVPLQYVLFGLTQHNDITIDNLQQLLRLNNVKFKKSLRKPDLVRLFLQID
jgi:hypothetical protein